MNGTRPARIGPGLRLLALFIAGGAGLLAAVWLIDGRSVLEKLLTRLVLPVGLIWLALTLQVAWTILRRRWLPALLAGVTWLLLGVAGNDRVAESLIWNLVDEYATVDPLAAPPFDTVILLGGGTRHSIGDRVELGHSGDRVGLAARLYHAGRVGRIICTGTRIRAFAPEGRDPAELTETLLVELGIPRHVLSKSPGTDTSSEMRHLAQVLEPAERTGVISSAWHMPRVLRLARQNGLELIPIPADFRITDMSGRPQTFGAWLYGLVPNVESLKTSTVCYREWLAGLVNR
ncbi:MAG: YdcF family protein [Maioricimonas sp. JB049]